jgi:hypothetical protein
VRKYRTIALVFAAVILLAMVVFIIAMLMSIKSL